MMQRLSASVSAFASAFGIAALRPGGQLADHFFRAEFSQRGCGVGLFDLSSLVSLVFLIAVMVALHEAGYLLHP
jgi:hypothetical protein